MFDYFQTFTIFLSMFYSLEELSVHEIFKKETGLTTHCMGKKRFIFINSYENFS